MLVSVRYFAALRDQRGMSEEQVSTSARTPLQLYRELQNQHGLSVDEKLVRFVMMDQFCDPNSDLSDGAIVEFLPPAAGG